MGRWWIYGNGDWVLANEGGMLSLGAQWSTGQVTQDGHWFNDVDAKNILGRLFPNHIFVQSGQKPTHQPSNAQTNYRASLIREIRPDEANYPGIYVQLVGGGTAVWSKGFAQKMFLDGFIKDIPASFKVSGGGNETSQSVTPPNVAKPSPDAVLVSCNDPKANFQNSAGCWYIPKPFKIQPVLDEDVNVRYSTSGDEITISTTIHNKKGYTREYRVIVYNSAGSKVAKEPDFFYKNIKNNASATITITSAFNPLWDINNVAPVFRVRVFEQKDGVVADKVIDLRSGSVSDEQFTPDNNEDVAPPVEGFSGGGNEGGAPIDFGNGNGLFDGIGGVALAIVAVAALGVMSKK